MDESTIPWTNRRFHGRIDDSVEDLENKSKNIVNKIYLSIYHIQFRFYMTNTIKNRKNPRTRPNKRKRRTIKKKMKREMSSVNPSPSVNPSTEIPIVYGRIHATWCGHCTAMEPAWKQIEEQNKLKPSGPTIFDIESEELEDKKNKFAKIYKSTLTSNGYPTIFKLHVKGGPIEYYTSGDRTEPAIQKWLFSKPKHM